MNERVYVGVYPSGILTNITQGYLVSILVQRARSEVFSMKYDYWMVGGKEGEANRWMAGSDGFTCMYGQISYG